jgi:tetratricopeptide (TPR) repeat protein
MIQPTHLYKKVFLFLLVFVSFLTLSCEKKVSHPTLGIDPVTDVALLEEHNEALARWAEMGIRNATVINIDAHDDTRWIREDKIEELRRLYINKEWDAIRENRRSGDKRLSAVGNFLYASAKLGIVSEVYWIIPFGHFSGPPSEKRLRVFLKSFSFEDKEIKTFHLDRGCFRGDFNGIPLAVCGIESLPDIDNSVILSLDMDFFAPFVYDYGVSRLHGLRMLFEALFKKKYMISDAVISFSIDGGYTRVLHRWISDQSVEILRNPAIIYQDRPPRLWTVRQEAETLFQKESTDKNLRHLLPLIDAYPDELQFLLYTSHIYYETGDINKAYRFAEKACTADKKYCHGIIEIGQKLLKDGKFNEAEKFFRKGYSLNPDMNFLQQEFGRALMKEGRYEDAIEYFKTARQMNGPLSSAFYMGEAYLSMGNKESALKHFDTARKAVALRRYIETSKKSNLDVVVSAVRFYEKNGYMKEASELKNNPKLRAAFQ